MHIKQIRSDEDIKRLALIVARNHVGPNDPIDEVLAEFGEDPSALADLLDDPVFKKYVKQYTQELQDKGLSFKLKSRLLAEDALAVIYGMVNDPDMPAVARLRAFELLAKYGGYDVDLNVQEKETLSKMGVRAESGPTFSITFNIPSLPAAPQPQPTTIDITPIPTTQPNPYEPHL